jgi:soluble lytic murein transglycosylase-like protein
MKFNSSILCTVLLIILSCHYSMAADSLNADRVTIIYKYFDAKGVLHLTSKPPKNRTKVLYARSYLVQPDRLPELAPPLVLPAPPPKSKPKSKPKPKPKPKASIKKHRKYDDYAPLIEKTANRVGLPAALLHAVVQTESAYNPKAVSPKGAVGLMQLMPATAKRYGVKDRTNPAANLNGGARYLRDLLTMFKQNLSLALAGYNAGENAVKRYGNKIPPYRETKNYVKKVKRLYHQYKNY